MSSTIPKILVVDDVAEFRNYIREILGEIGLTDIIEAADGLEALKQLGTHDMDLVISDYMMDRVSGMSLLRVIRQRAPLRNTPFIMLTAIGNTATHAQAEQFGVTHYLTKPLDVTLFHESVLAALENIGSLQ